MAQLPLVQDFVYLTCHTDTSPRSTKIIMAPIDENIEKRIDKGFSADLKCGDYSFYVAPSDILTYGDIDIESDLDLDMIEHINFNIDSFSGFTLPSHYDFETHSVSGKKFYQTWNKEKIFKFKYAQLGKPDKIIIFKHR